MENLIEAIKQLKKEKNAVILGHYYQRGEIQDIADYVGDSLALAQWAAKTEADIIVMCGVHFMGETAKVLCPEKKVLVPDMAAGCSLADSCPADAFAKFVEEHPGHTVISYVNTTAAVKAVTDVVVTSTNARQIVESFPQDEKIIFGPDRNLGSYINAVTGRQMLLWDGACHVHEQFSVEKIVELKKQHPGAVVLAEDTHHRYVLHRIIRREGDALTLLGDGNVGQTEQTDIHHVMGLLTAVIRKGRTYPTDGTVWQHYSRWWKRLTPVRRWLLAIYRRI